MGGRSRVIVMIFCLLINKIDLLWGVYLQSLILLIRSAEH